MRRVRSPGTSNPEAEERARVEGASGETPEEEAEGKEAKGRSSMSNVTIVASMATMPEIVGPRKR